MSEFVQKLVCNDRNKDYMFQECNEFGNPKLFENLVANLTDDYAEIQYFCQTHQAVVHATHCKTFCPCQKINLGYSC